MSRRRFWVERLPEPGQGIRLDARATHHVSVLRLGRGAAIQLFDGRGREGDAEIVEIRDSTVLCRVRATRDCGPDWPEVHLIQSVPKGRKLDALVRMVTEVGVSGIHLAHTERTIADTGDAKLDRIVRVAREAARQAERADVPVIHRAARLDAVLGRIPTAAHRIALDRRAPETLRDVLTTTCRETWIAVGPEGGFSEADENRLFRTGFRWVSLGPTVLRTETAPVAGVAVVRERLREIAEIVDPGQPNEQHDSDPGVP